MHQLQAGPCNGRRRAYSALGDWGPMGLENCGQPDVRLLAAIGCPQQPADNIQFVINGSMQTKRTMPAFTMH